MAKRKSAKKAWEPTHAYNIQTVNGTPMNIDQGSAKRTIYFTGPNVWNVPQDKDEEGLMEHYLSHAGNGYTMRKLPFVKQRPDGFWLPDREGIKATLEANTTEEE